LSPEGEVVREAAPAPLLTVAFALTKGDHPEWAVQKLTEAGVDRVVLMTTERCVVRWAPAATGRHLERLRDVARQAAMQSRRAWLPAIEGPLSFAEVVAGDGRGASALAVPGGRPLTLATPTVLIGPEGGWTDAELGSGPDHVGLGPHILRAETAALAAGVLLAGLRARFVAPAPHSAPATPTRTKN
jgi:16S rRNA (uracil1498-N3)-methyltransferase